MTLAGEKAVSDGPHADKGLRPARQRKVPVTGSRSVLDCDRDTKVGSTWNVRADQWPTAQNQRKISVPPAMYMEAGDGPKASYAAVQVFRSSWPNTHTGEHHLLVPPRACGLACCTDDLDHHIRRARVGRRVKERPRLLPVGNTPQQHFGQIPTDASHHPRKVRKPPDPVEQAPGDISSGVFSTPGELPGGSLRPPDPIPPGSLRPPDRIPGGSLRPPDPIPPGSLRPPDLIPRESLRPPEPIPSGAIRPPDSNFSTDDIGPLPAPIPCEDLQTPHPHHGGIPSKLLSKLKHKSRRHRQGLDSDNPVETLTANDQPPTGTRSENLWFLKAKKCLNSLPSKKQRFKEKTRNIWHKLSCQNPHAEVPEQAYQTPRKHANDGASRQSQRGSLRSTSSMSQNLTAESDTSSMSSYTNLKKPHLDMTIHPLPLIPPHPFQCTFCLTQCASEHDWLQHEYSAHLLEQEWAEPPDVDHKLRKGGTTSHNAGKSGNDRFWNCGFCDMLLRSWDERQGHIAEHFLDGTTMISWDPLKSPYPWERGSTCGPPGWNMASLFASQQPNLVGILNMITKAEEPYMCRVCNAMTGDSKALVKHMDLWHVSRTGWSCSRLMNKDLDPGPFFDTYPNPDGTTDDCCHYCDESLQCTPAGPDLRLRHLKEKHKFDGHSCTAEACFNDKQFSLHLATEHKIPVDEISEFMKFCKTRRHIPALMVT